jgi:hypothetical protein
MFKFYANINGTNEGPFTLEELKELASEKKITPSTFVIIEGTEEWLPAKDVEGLFPPGPKLPNLPPTPPRASDSLGAPPTPAGLVKNPAVAVGESPLKYAWARFKLNPGFYLVFGAITLLIFPIFGQIASGISNFIFAAVAQSGGGDPEVFMVFGQILGIILASIIGLFSAPFYATFFSGMSLETGDQKCAISKIFSVGQHFLSSMVVLALTTLAVTLGFIFCIIPGIILLPLIPISFVYLSRGSGSIEAISKAFSLMKSKPSIVLNSIGYLLVGILGVLLCCIGQVATYPIAYAAIYKAVLDQEAT